MNHPQLRKIKAKIPSSSGIYIFKNSASRPIYIGKAVNLKARIRGYLKDKDARIIKMIDSAAKLDWIETGSEIEALILESQYIKKYKPFFNIVMRDDKQYGFVGFTDERFPKIFITHQPNLSLQAGKLTSWQARFIGPFTDIGALKTTLRHLRRVFPYCTCKNPHNNYCLNYHLDKCLGFCCLKNTPYDAFLSRYAEYRKNIKAITDILSGKKNSLLKELEKEMIALGKKGRFQEAIELRNKIEKIKRVFENVVVIQRNANLQMHTNTANNPYFDTSKNHNKEVLEDFKNILNLKKPPTRIEGYDIANIQGQYAVGAMVVFENGVPNKNEYRKFKIRHFDISKFRNIDMSARGDTGMLKEILIRRFRHSGMLRTPKPSAKEWPTPDLIVVDGGKAQLSAVLKVISNFEFLTSKQVPVVALTKDGRHQGVKIFISGKKNPIPLSQMPISAKNLLLQVGSEAHRFAIAYYRHRHRKTLL